jgi:Zn-dependent protease
MKTKFKLFNFLGIPVNLNILFLALFLFLPVSVAVSVFISVLIHEMAHAYIAQRKGYNVYGIEIGLFNGSAAIDTNIHERDSIPVTAAGPISNLLLLMLSGLFYLLIIANPSGSMTVEFLENFMYVNLFLFLFNILPIYPMDGGRILKDYLLIKNRRTANKISNKVSLVFSSLLIIGSLIYGYLFMAIFGLFFAYTALKNLKLIKF